MIKMRVLNLVDDNIN